MAKFRYKLPDVENLKATGTAFLEIPLGDTFHNFLCVLGGTTFNRSHIKRVRVMLNGKPFMRDLTAAEMHKLNLYRMSKDDADVLLVDFEEPRARQFADQIATIIGTASGVNTMRLEFDIEGATAPEMTVFANASGPQPLGMVPALVTEDHDFVSTGNKTVRFPYAVGPVAKGGAGHIIKRAHLFLSGGAALSEVTLKKNGIPVHDRITPRANTFFQEHYEGVPITDAYTVDFVEDNNVVLNLVGTEDANSIHWDLKVGAVGHMRIVYELISPLESV